ncbi:hypothetical protein CP533_1746 [Ophiocordyceps camponoti-saundersi (nom. inval.)]|nr:hypothetical protein CP533_1746 [Ophiocordyceps camponoti-saundersi (nom. inval.)]
MLFGIKTLLLSLFATACVALTMDTYQKCTKLAIISGCRVSAEVRTDNDAVVEVDGSDGCTKPKGLRVLTRVCIDWRNKRAHLTFRGNVLKHCLKQLPVVRCEDSKDENAPAPSWCFKNHWVETPSTRSPSTSPPPEPPPEAYMTSEDDRYRMVEDELLRTARLFTIHLHRAEYERQKAQAKAQHAATIREMERPVVGDPSVSAHLRAAVEMRDARQGAGLVDSPLRAGVRVAGLRRLMDCPRGVEDGEFSSAGAPVLSTTRAAAPSRRDPGAPPSTKPTAIAHSSSSTNQPDPPTAYHQGVEADTKRREDARKRHGASDKSEPDLSDDDPFSIKRRRLQRQRARDQQHKNRDAGPSPKSLPDTIPSFL